MLHANHRALGSGDEDFLRFSIYGRGGHFGHVPWTIYANTGSPFPWMLHMTFDMTFDFDWQNGFREDLCDWRTDDRPLDGGRTEKHKVSQPKLNKHNFQTFSSSKPFSQSK